MSKFEFRTAAACTKTETVMRFTPKEWEDFLAGAKNGEFDLSA